MFFLMGISRGEKKLDYVKTIICVNCSKYGRYEIFMTYTYLSLFFIPVLKWDKRYYVKTTCCQNLYELDAIVGKKILNGQETDIRQEDLTPVNGHSFNKSCPACGYIANSDFIYCPKCGKQL